jgi:hypothetical protein
MGNEVVGLHQVFSNANGGQHDPIPTVWLVITNGLVTYKKVDPSKNHFL